MATIEIVGGLILILGTVWEAFEAIVLPRRVTRRVRLTRVFYRSTWTVWARLGQRLLSGKRRDTFLAVYGPMSLLILLTVWAGTMVFGFALVHMGMGSHLEASGAITFATDVYMSGTTFFTLGLGDVVPRTAAARVVTVIEAGMGFGFLALVIGYLPIIYQAFSRREVGTVLLDARAGSPPTAGELLRRGSVQSAEALQQFLVEWERWSAEVLESHISYPLLAFYRSQHSNESWLAALTAILDFSALVMAGSIDGLSPQQAGLTFAIARHTAVDLAQVLSSRPVAPARDRLPPAELDRMRQNLAAAGVFLHVDAMHVQRLSALRRTYEPYVNALSTYLRMPLPSWMPLATNADNWQTSAWERMSSHAPQSVSSAVADEHG